MNEKCNGNWNPDKIPQVCCSMYLPNLTNDEVEKIVMSLITQYTFNCFEKSGFFLQSLLFGILDISHKQSAESTNIPTLLEEGSCCPNF